MGYMGLGLQKWIYGMRPRKPYSMQRKGSFTEVPTYSRAFKLQYSNNEGSYNFGIVLFVVMVLLIALSIPRWLEDSKKRHQYELALAIQKDNDAFTFLLKSGKSRLHKGRISGAYSEFKLAYAIKPNNKELNSLLLETLEILCLDYNRHCDDYLKLE